MGSRRFGWFGGSSPADVRVGRAPSYEVFVCFARDRQVGSGSAELMRRDFAAALLNRASIIAT
jgi:hypothetical protein